MQALRMTPPFHWARPRWTQGRISEAMLRVYVRKGIITKADFEEICGKKY